MSTRIGIAAQALTSGLVLLALTACATPAPPTVTAQIRIELRWPLIADTLDSEDSAAEQCAGGMDFVRIRTGSVMTIKDSKGSIVAVAALPPPRPADNLVVCTWSTSTSFASREKFFTAEVGGWVSSPVEAAGDQIEFHLDTIDEDPEFGSTAQIDPAWTLRE